MARPMKRFTIEKRRFAKGYCEGINLAADGVLRVVGEKAVCCYISPRLDSAEGDCRWGRMILQIELPREAQLTLVAFATNQDKIVWDGKAMTYSEYFSNGDISWHKKLALMEGLGCQKVKNARDLLLYQLEGRFLWFALEIQGADTGSIHQALVYAQREDFMQTFPEIYRRNSDFMSRYLSIFSSIYSDVQRRVDSLEQIVNIDTAPVEMLPVFAGWIGLDLGGNFLESGKLRALLKTAYTINRYKGTRRAITDVARLLLEQEPYVIEQQTVSAYVNGENKEVYRKLYGADPQCVTVMASMKPDEKFHSQFLFLLNQFKPIRTQVNLVFLQNNGQLDGHCYMDVNGVLVQNTAGELDEMDTFNTNIVLQ